MGHVELTGDRRGAYRVQIGRPGRKRPLVRHRHRLEDSIKVGLQEMGWGSMDWITVARDRNRWRAVVDAAMNLRVP